MAKISNQDVAAAIYKSLKDKVGSRYKDSLANVVNFLARKRLLSQAPEILRKLERIMDKEKGTLRVELSSARPLGTQVKHDLANMIERRYRAREIIFREEVDESLIGGFKVELNDEIIDLTIKNKIKKLEEHLK